jgi:hypothetical protein
MDHLILVANCQIAQIPVDSNGPHASDFRDFLGDAEAERCAGKSERANPQTGLRENGESTFCQRNVLEFSSSDRDP